MLKKTLDSEAMKRAFDTAAASILLVASLPLTVPIAIGVRVSTGSPILYWQQRPGQYGKEFWIIKFRTMDDSDRLEEERITRFGRWLRNKGLDELPQLWNVVKGEMSLVGPRPMLKEPKNTAKDPADQAKRLSVRPGITGPDQTSRRNGEEPDFPKILEKDLNYIDTRTFVGDLRYLWKTAAVCFAGKGDRFQRPSPSAISTPDPLESRCGD